SISRFPQNLKIERRSDMSTPHHDDKSSSHHGHEGHNHDEHAGHSATMFKDRFWLSLLLSIPVIVFSPMFTSFLAYTVPEFPASTWFAPLLGTVSCRDGWRRFLQGGLSVIRSRRPGRMLLIAMAIIVAFIASWVTTLGIGGFELDFWWELALLVFIMLLGH